MFIHITESGFKLTLQLLQDLNKSSVTEVLLQRFVTCGCCSEFWEVDEFTIRSPQSYFVLECSEYLHQVIWKLVSLLELQVGSVRVRGNVSQEDQLYDPVWLF